MTERLEPAEAFAEIGRIKLGATDLDGVLRRVAGLARDAIPNTDEVSVTLVQGGTGRTAASTSMVARDLDEWQYHREHGPCLDASASGDAVSVPDTADEERWPEWATAAQAVGISSSLSVGLPIQEAVTGALNIYSRIREAYDPAAVDLAKTFAAYAAVAVANAQLYDSTATLARQMQTAMEGRAVIEQAKGIIMGDRRCGADEAFALLSKISQDTNRRVRDVAAALVERATGHPPLG
ncbi:GAF and ANTAR domain-containing protein [Plantactinospora siamensis]|uniref:GAF and ANTAR domain-containing protein n=1 Tax=Plantactinospora siamensis TaxID=555372 RepID=A0ABV6P7S0_9ACTN